MNPDFNQLADWVRWVAQDADGTWWGYEHEPNLADIAWYENEVGRQLRLGQTRPSGDWTSTLRKI